MSDDAVIYLDYNASTPVDPRVLEAMLPWFTQRFANASSRQHGPGQAAAKAVEQARGQVAALLGGDEREILFTSGATEANNLALKGAVRWLRDEAKRGAHLVISSIEHSSVREVIGGLERAGYSVTLIDPTPSGVITAEAVNAAMRPDTAMVSVMWANNETGVINDIPAIGRLCRERGVLLHTDATQMVGKLPVNVNEACVDLLSLSGHKLYGPKGVGALFARRKSPRVRLEPMMEGGGHERGVRSGTLNVPGIVGLGAACALAGEQMTQDARRMSELRDAMEQRLGAAIQGLRVNGQHAPRLPQTSSVLFPGVDAERMLARMTGVACSSGAACSTAAMQTSHVLRRLGLSEDEARGVLRLSLGRFTAAVEIDGAVTQLVAAYQATRAAPASAACEF